MRIGTAAAAKLFRLYPGRCCCGQLAANEPAIRFWHSVYEAQQCEFYKLGREEDLQFQRSCA